MSWLSDNLPTIVNGLATGFLLYTIALGLSLIFGMMDVLNLAHGTLYLVGAYIGVEYIAVRGISWASFLVAALIAAVVGVLLGGVVAGMVTPLAGRGHMDQALLTLGLALVGANLMQSAFGGNVQSLPPPPALSGNVQMLGHPYPTYRLALIGFGVVVAIVVTLLMSQTKLGAIVRATVYDRDMVRAIGIDTRKILFGIFGFGALLAVLGGVLGGPLRGAAPGLDDQVLLIALVVVVVGGLGSIWGALIGSLIIGEIQSLGTALVPTVAPFLLFGAMAVVLVVRPGGLLGSATEMRAS
jgi:branched-subunit amino acid ABC-type transport system permease component